MEFPTFSQFTDIMESRDEPHPVRKAQDKADKKKEREQKKREKNMGDPYAIPKAPPPRP